MIRFYVTVNMKVKNFRAFRVIKTESLNYEESVFSGKTSICRNDFSCNFRQVYEAVFEEVRGQQCPELPSRLECIFVFPNKDNYFEWTPYEGGQCYLLELELEGNLVWLDAKFINEDLTAFLLKADNLNEKDMDQIREIAAQYWDTASEKELNSVQCEGLFVGKAKIVTFKEVIVQPKCHKMQTSIKVCSDYMCNPSSDEELLKD